MSAPTTTSSTLRRTTSIPSSDPAPSTNSARTPGAALLASFTAEWRRLSRPRLALVTLGLTAIFAVAVTWLIIGTDSSTGPANAQAVRAAGGATLPVAVASGFTSVLARKWFPGLLMRGMLNPDNSLVSQPRLYAVLALYCVVALTATLVVVHRRDVTS